MVSMPDARNESWERKVYVLRRKLRLPSPSSPHSRHDAGAIHVFDAHMIALRSYVVLPLPGVLSI